MSKTVYKLRDDFPFYEKWSWISLNTTLETLANNDFSKVEEKRESLTTGSIGYTLSIYLKSFPTLLYTVFRSQFFVANVNLSTVANILTTLPARFERKATK